MARPGSLFISMNLSGKQDRLILFTRYPRPGRVKTRLIPSLGPDLAAAVQREMTARALAQAHLAARMSGAEVEVRFDGGTRAEMAALWGPGADYQPQGEGDLGERMRRAFGDAFEEGVRRAVLFGADIPDLNAELMVAGLAELDRSDLVLGPALDGGYYLIGLKENQPELFKGIHWGAANVLSRTQNRARELSVEYLPELGDVDLPRDLARLRSSTRSAESSLAVIIPTLNEAENIEACLRSVFSGNPDEVLVIDAGSIDGTREIAGRMGARVELLSGGRAAQQNHGAALARGSNLLFLHGDTVLPEGWREELDRILAEPATALGAFRFSLPGTRPGYRIVEGLAGFRSIRLKMPYGDQGLFMKADRFWEAGGFPIQPLMDDFVLVRNLGRLGRVVTSNLKASTSPRRWENMGVWRTTLVNQMVIVGWWLGVSPRRLAGWYNAARGRRMGGE